MAYISLSQSYGASKANLPCTIVEVSTGVPAVILNTSTGGVVSNTGDCFLDGSGNLSVYVEGGRTWQVNVDSGATPGPVGLLTSAQITAGAMGVAGVTPEGVLKGIDGSTLSGGGGGGATNLTYTASSANGIVVSDSGTDATIPLADGTNAGLMPPASVTKLSGVATGATANSADSFLLDRTNHTGTQLSTTISNFTIAVDARIGNAVVNSLASSSTVTPLSAAQGKALKDTADVLATTVGGKQATLVSGTNIRTINGNTLLGSTDLVTLQPGVQLTQAAVTAATAAGVTLLDAADSSAQRTALGLGTAATQATGVFATAAQGAKADTAAQSVGTYATSGALETAFPAASNLGKTANIGSTAPYTLHVSNGSTWAQYIASGTKALSAYYAAVNNRESAPVKIVGIGDSWMEYRTVTAFGKQWTQLIQAVLRSKYPVSGLGAVGGIGYVPIQNVSIFAPYTNPWVKAGSVGSSFTSGGLGLRYATFTTSSDKATITVTGTSCILHYLKGASSRVGYYRVDGGAPVTFETNNGVVTDDGFLPITLGSSGSHTLEVGWSSGSIVYLAGAIFFNGDEGKGFHFYEGGHTAYRTTDYVTGAAGADALFTRIGAIAPHLVILALGQNDFAIATPNFISAAQYKNNLKSIITSIRAKGVSASFLIVMSAEVTAVKDATQTATWAQFQAAAKQIAIEDTGNGGASGVTVVSITDSGVIYPSTGLAFDIWADGAHVSDTGHISIAQVISNAI